MKRHSQRKRFYPPGLIALVVFSAGGFWKIAQLYDRFYKPLHATEVTWPVTNNEPDNTFQIDYILKQRTFLTYRLVNNSEENQRILNSARRELTRIKKDQDVTYGVQLIFNEKTNWQDFITAVDYFGEKFPPAFVPYDNGMVAMYVPIDTANFPKDRLDEMKRKGAFDYK